MNRLVREVLKNRRKESKLAAPPEEEVKAFRFTPERIRRLRTKLGIPKRQLGLPVEATNRAEFM
jgi:hypothetical protein